MLLGHMAKIPFPVLAGVKKQKIKTMKKIKEFDYFDFLIIKSSLYLIFVVFALLNNLLHLHKTGNRIIVM